jgi:signal peptidase II
MFFLVFVDQLTKTLALAHLPKHETFSYLNDLIRIGVYENKGAFLSIGSQLSEFTRFLIFTVAVGGGLICLLSYLIINSNQSRISLISLSVVFSGGLSNFYDRIANNGAVIDFLNVGIYSFRTGIFNFADVFIMIGVFIYLLINSIGKEF